MPHHFPLQCGGGKGGVDECYNELNTQCATPYICLIFKAKALDSQTSTWSPKL
ncbi:hypothetical protein BGP_1895 [Beggiatoa sp. PS]|nr:hypothetical protein BGP_1895 [Beggiatoa sp. PS]